MLCFLYFKGKKKKKVTFILKEVSLDVHPYQSCELRTPLSALSAGTTYVPCTSSFSAGRSKGEDLT